VVINWPLAHLSCLEIEFSFVFHPAPNLCHHIRKDEFRLLGKHTMAHHPCFRTSRRTPVDAVPMRPLFSSTSLSSRCLAAPHSTAAACARAAAAIDIIAAECVSSTSSTNGPCSRPERGLLPAGRHQSASSRSAFTRCAGIKRTRRISIWHQACGPRKQQKSPVYPPQVPQPLVLLQRTGTGTARSP
jgi:hypothetical protein